MGCYYHLLGRDTLAQKHFLKATQLDPKCAVAWIGFGNAFSAKEESPQAVRSAYIKTQIHKQI